MDDLLEAGIKSFNDGRYYDAHEAWEDLWRTAGGPLRLYYQGLVQAAVGMHHLTQNNPDGGRSLLNRALEKLEEYPPRFCGIENADLVSRLRRVLATDCTDFRDIRVIRDIRG